MSRHVLVYLLLFITLLPALAGCALPANDDDLAVSTDDDDIVDDDHDDDDDTTGDDDDDSGDDDDDDSTEFIQPDGAWTQIACGGSSVCVLDESGRPFCWWYGSQERVAAPMDGFEEIAIWGENGCGLDASGAGRCWGASLPGNLIPQVPLYSLQRGAALRQDTGRPTFWGGAYALPNPAEVLPPTFQLHHGGGAGCVRETDRIFCQSRDLTPEEPGVTVILPGQYTDIAGGYRYVCGLSTDGSIVCDGTDADNVGVLNPPAPGDWTELIGYGRSPCARSSTGVVECWGSWSAVVSPSPMLSICDSGDTGWKCGIELTTNDIRCWGSSVPDNLSQFE